MMLPFIIPLLSLAIAMAFDRWRERRLARSLRLLRRNS